MSNGSAAFDSLLSYLPYLREQAKDPAAKGELYYILEGVTEEVHQAPHVLFRQGAPVEKVYLLIEGRVEEIRTLPRQQGGHNILLRESEPVRLLGIYDVLFRQHHNTWARVLVESKVLAIDARQINRLLYQFPELRAQIAPLDKISRLRTIPLLEHADEVSVGFLADVTEAVTYQAGQQIYASGDLVEKVFMIDAGQVQLTWDSGQVLWLGNGAAFGVGERANDLTSGAYPLDHNAVALCETKLLAAPRRQFAHITSISPEQEVTRLRVECQEAIDRIPAFAKWEQSDRTRLLGFMSHYHISSNHLLTQQGEAATSMWVLMPRRNALVHAVGGNQRTLPLTRVEGPTYFGEGALRYPAPASSTLEAEANSQWLRLHRDDFRVFLDQAKNPELERSLQLGAVSEQAQTWEKNPKFPWLQRSEYVVFLARRHWFALLRKLIGPILLSFVLALIGGAIYRSGYDAAWTMWFVGLLGLITLLWTLWGVEDYRNDYLMITNMRVVHQEKVILLREARQMAPLEEVQNVGVEISFWGRLLGYADIQIQTASTGGMVRFDRMGEYKAAEAALKDLRASRRQTYQATGKREIYSLLEKRFVGAPEPPDHVWPVITAPQAEAPPTGFGARWFRRSRSQTDAERDTGERIVWRKHWIVLFRNLSLPVILTISFLGAALFVWWTRIAGELTSAATGVPILFAVVFAGLIFWVVEDWLNDMYVLEAEQVIDIEAKPLGFDEKRKVAQLAKIVDLNMAMPTPIHYIFNFGNVFLQTAATEGLFTFDSVPDPHGVVEIVRRRMEAVRHRNEVVAARQRAQELPDWFEIYNRLDPPRANEENK